MGVPRLIGMIHLGPLPGSPLFAGDLDAIVAAAVRDAVTLEETGFGGLMIENFGDVPFFTDDVPKLTVAAMTRVVDAVRGAVELPIGINVLRNDAVAALSIAAATEASYVRVNVLNGVMYTDQGPIVGRAADVLRLRAEIAPAVAVMADVFVKHAVPPPGLTVEAATRDLAGRGGADIIVVSGSATGDSPDFDRVERVKAAAGSTPVFIGSGMTSGNAPELLAIADGCIVGTALKRDGAPTNPVEAALATRFVAAAA